MNSSQMDAWKLTLLLQLCDSGFPNGSFAHSFGLETLIEEGVVRDAPTFLAALYEYVHLQLIPFEGLIAHLAWSAADNDHIGILTELSEIYRVSTVPERARQGAMSIGQRTLMELIRIAPFSDDAPNVVSQYAQRVATGETSAAFPVVIAAMAAEIGISKHLAVPAVLYTAISTMTSAAVRTVPLGQSSGQQILAQARRWLCDLPEYEGKTMEDIASASPGWEIAQMNHALLDGRLFMS